MPRRRTDPQATICRRHWFKWSWAWMGVKHWSQCAKHSIRMILSSGPLPNKRKASPTRTCYVLRYIYVLLKTRRGRFHSVRAGKHVSHEKCDREWRQHATDDSNESNCTSPGRLVDGAGLVTSQGEDYIFRRSELATERISLYSCTKSSALKPSMFSRKILDFTSKKALTKGKIVRCSSFFSILC